MHKRLRIMDISKGISGIGDVGAMYLVPGKFPNILVWRGGWGVPKGPKCETAHESGPKCESRQAARRPVRSQMCNVEEPGGPAGHRICHLVPNVKEYIRICYMVLNVNGLKIQISAGLGAPQGRKSRSDLDQPNIPVWRRGWGGP